jgi:hypothetical protein
MFSTKPILAGVAACAFLAGCSGLSQSSSSSQSLPQSKARKFGGFVPPAGTPVVYASGYDTGDVYIYSQAGKNQTPIGTITGFGNPYGVAVDSSGNLYVADEVSETITVFHQGQGAPFETLTEPSPYYNLASIALDSNNNVYALQGNTVTIWAAGSTTPTSSLTAHFSGSSLNTAIAVDAAGDVYVGSNQNGELDEFPAGSTEPVVVRTNNNKNGWGPPVALSFDSQQRLIVVERIGDFKKSSIDVYAPPYTGKPIAKGNSKAYIYAATLNSDDSALWLSANANATQVTYPGVKKVESTKTYGAGFKGIAAYPAAPL